MISFCIYRTVLGNVQISEEFGMITSVNFQPTFSENLLHRETVLIKTCYKQLCEYLKGNRKSFDLPLNPKGTDFQKRVWSELTKIPYGKTKSYKQIAESIKSPKACRAVGLANNKNPIPIIIPCHRVVGSNGDLIGYAGGLHRKKFLLNLEQTSTEQELAKPQFYKSKIKNRISQSFC